MPITDYYVTTDAMGSVMAVLDEAGNVLERRSYDAFGEATYMLPDGTVVPDSPTGVDIGFQGQLMDELTGMYQMGFRWYSPVLGRWVSRDPIGLAGGVNLVCFSYNQATVYFDLTGLKTVSYDISGRDVRIPLLKNYFKDTSFRVNLDISECPFEVVGTIELTGNFEFPAVKGASALLDVLSGGNLKLNLSGSVGGHADVNYSECHPSDGLRVCVMFEALASIEKHFAGITDASGRFTRTRFGGGAAASVLFCVNLCNGDIDVNFDYSYALLGNFGNKNVNRTSGIGSGGGLVEMHFERVESFAVLKDFCNRHPNQTSCCCEKKYGVSRREAGGGGVL